MRKADIFVPIVLLAAGLLAAERSGPYLGAGVGLGSYDDDGRLAKVEAGERTQYRFAGGAFINRHLSVALAYGRFEAFEGRTAEGALSSERFETISAEAAAHYPVWKDRIDLFAKFGAGEIFWDQTAPGHHSSSAAVLVYGVGIGFRPQPRVTLNAGYDLYRFSMDANGTSFDMGLGSAYVGVEVQF